MTPQDLIAAFDIPPGCRVDQRVPKKLVVENGAPTTCDKRTINEGIEELRWIAALKPNTIGVPEYRDDTREYLEIALLSVTLRPEALTPAKSARLIELIHRAIPYPVLLVTSGRYANQTALSLANKRHAQNEAGKVVLDTSVTEVILTTPSATPNLDQAFTTALSLRRQSATNLYALHQSWIDALHALQAARLKGTFALAANPAHAAAREAALAELYRMEAELTRLRNAATRETQLARQVELNLQVQHLQARRAEAMRQL